ncbi:MAG: hypothetical protein IJR88_03210 [Clostridia bacterium]|nr:hypothetical protein [Clostridia bacterium]
MDERENRIKGAIDEIEPADGAKERMLANIKRKVEDKNIQEILAKEPQKAKILSFNRAMKWVLPVAACFVIVLGAVLILPNLLSGKQADAAEMAAPHDSYMNADYGADYEPASEKSNSGAFRLPANASDPIEISDSDQLGYSFTVDGYSYVFNSVSLDESQKAAAYKTEELEEDAGIPLEEDAWIFERNDGYEIIWIGEGYLNSISNTNGADKEEVIKVFESMR